MTEVLERSQARRWFTRAALVATAATVVLATTATSASAVTTDGFNPGPVRLIDTRQDMPDRPAGAVTGFLQTQLPDSVPDGDSALLSITVVSPTTSGYIKAYADGTPFPATSDVNFIAGPGPIAQAVLVPAAAGSTGKIDLFIGGNSADIQLVVDVIGSFPAASYTSLPTAERTFDTRSPAINTPAGKVTNTTVSVLMPSDIPDDAQAVAITLTQVNGTGPGYVTALSGSTPTGASSLNFTSTSINSNLVFVKPIGGRIYLQVLGSTDLIVDVKGYSLSERVSAQSPTRVLDTRVPANDGQIGVGTFSFNAPADAPEGASFALLNVTSTESQVPGYLASYKASGSEQQTSNLNWVAGQNIAGFVLAPIVDGKISVYVGVGLTELVADVQGYVVNAPEQQN